ncbi:GNAT family N-acetyltransferase [Agromyces aurantiacus]|uniref:GNAT family N-acetyltransferase n=1 Tax=Agromyces aurantiacus TaxID=165814 RepID=A0ABV9R5Y2_9MICO|nr:GNAT family N-acetyltransferase [Agromyces aurantiacus]MBM7506069.1 RimJ/RimL family protein N-acetyltransferase [Agromyces aurantiacus]
MSRTSEGSPMVEDHGDHSMLRLLRSALPQRPRFLRGPRIPDGVRSPVIRTERLLLRPHRLADADAWYALQSDPRVIEHLSWPLRTRAESFVHLAHRTRHTRLEQRNDFLALAVVLDGQLIGDASLHLRSLDRAERRLEIGWVIGPQWQGRGYAREAAEAMLRLAFEDVSAAVVEAHMTSANEASTALAERLGFELRSDDGVERVMVMTADDWRSRHPLD